MRQIPHLPVCVNAIRGSTVAVAVTFGKLGDGLDADEFGRLCRGILPADA